MPPSSSSLSGVDFRQKLREAVMLLRLRRDKATRRADLLSILDQLSDYRTTYERLTGRPFSEARVFEIGYGAQPIRLIALASMGVDVRGIDKDVPMLRFRPVQLLRILAANGLERTLKTGLRSLLFDRGERTELKSALAHMGYSLRIDPERFLVGDATTWDYASWPPDLVYSEHVFEHIPPAQLEELVARLAAQMSPHGVAMITPNVFTGITGGHLPEWYWDSEEDTQPRRSEPWEHLRKRRFTANTYLNELPRVAYRELFARFFTIVEERVVVPEFGRHRLTPALRDEMAQWSDEELFSNAVLFVLRPKTPT